MTTLALTFLPSEEGSEFTDAQKKYISFAGDTLVSIINKQPFQDKVENYKFKTRNGRIKAKFRYNNGMSRAEIFAYVMSGKDSFGGADGDIDLHLFPYDAGLRYHAATSMDKIEIKLNRNYVDACISNEDKREGLAELTNTLLHEYLHNLGFKHRGNRPTRFNKTTVPYAIGEIVEQIIRGDHSIAVE